MPSAQQSASASSQGMRAPGSFSAREIAEILRAIPPRPNYGDWIKVIGAVGSALAEADAVAVLQDWSPEEQPGEYARKLRNSLGRVGVGTLIAMAKTYGFDAAGFSRRRLAAQYRAQREDLNPFRANRSMARSAADRQGPRYPLRPGTREELAALARLRGLDTIVGLEAMQAAGHLAFADTIKDKSEAGDWYRVVAWVVTDSTCRNQSARRLDGQAWRCLGGAKSRCISGPGSKAWPVGIADVKPGQRIDLVEGEADLLALWHLYATAAVRDAAPVALLGTCTDLERFGDEIARHVSGRLIQIFPHVDAHGAGQHAAQRWAAALYGLGAAGVRLRDLRPWLQPGGKDLLDAVVSGASVAGSLGSAPLCPACFARGIIAPQGGPTCSCRTYVWPQF